MTTHRQPTHPATDPYGPGAPGDLTAAEHATPRTEPPRRRLRAVALSVIGLLAVLVGSLAATQVAQARVQCSTERYAYRFSNVHTEYLPTTVKSDWLRGPGSISYTKTKTAEVNASVTAEVGAEAGVVFAKASASIGTTVGGSYAKSQTWSYSLNVPAGKTARMVLSHEARGFTVTKVQLDAGGCKAVRTIYSSNVVAPIKANVNVWGLQYR